MSSDEAHLEEWAWLARAADGDDASFHLLVERYQGRLLNYFLRAGAKEHAEDLVQETFIRLYRHRSRAKPLARFTTYAHTLAHHVWIDHLRKHGRALRTQEAVRAHTDTEDQRSSRTAPARLDAERLLDALSPDLRDTVVLVVYQGLTHPEAAEALGIPEGTVKSRIFHAMQRMRALLDEQPHARPHEPHG